MATDDDDRGSASDPWDEIVAGSLGDAADEVSFRFDEMSSDPQPSAAPEASGSSDENPAAAAPAAEDRTADDALVEDWLAAEEGDSPDAVPPLAVFPPDDAAAGTSAIDIGTGSSGIALHGPADQEEIGDSSFADTPSSDDGAEAGWPGIETAGAEATEGVVAGGFPDVAQGAAVVAATAAAAKAPKRAAKPAKQAGGIGQMIGVVLGGLLALPIVAGLLIGYAWMGGRDAIGLRKTPLAFLMPPKATRSATAGTNAGGSALDSLPTLDTSSEPAGVGDTKSDESESNAGEPAVADSGVEPSANPVVDPVEPVVEPVVDPVDPVADTVVDPVSAPATDVVAFAPPGLDALDPPPPPVAPGPPPLDTAALDEAVGEAAALCEALGAVDDRENRGYRLLRTRWYRALARVAEELVAIDHAAATSGRPLAAAPENVADLHGGIGGREALVAELAALAPDWLAYAKRGSDGVVVPVTFESARKVGPYWTTRATLTAADGTARELTVISRTEPTAVAGDRLVVTGVVLDGAVVWAADVRAAEAGVPPASF